MKLEIAKNIIGLYITSINGTINYNNYDGDVEDESELITDLVRNKIFIFIR